MYAIIAGIAGPVVGIVRAGVMSGQTRGMY